MLRFAVRPLLLAALAALALAVGSVGPAGANESEPVELSDVMKDIKKAMRTAVRAADAQEMAVALAAMQEAAERAAEFEPESVDGDALDAEQMEHFRTGVEQMQELIETGLAAAEAGDAKAAGEALDQIGDLRNDRHDFLGVGD